MQRSAIGLTSQAAFTPTHAPLHPDGSSDDAGISGEKNPEFTSFWIAVLMRSMIIYRQLCCCLIFQLIDEKWYQLLRTIFKGLPGGPHSSARGSLCESSQLREQQAYTKRPTTIHTTSVTLASNPWLLPPLATFPSFSEVFCSFFMSPIEFRR